MSGRRATQGLLGVAIGLALVARLAQITSRQREIYGDIAIVFDYVDRILAGHFPSAFILSAGPLYHYLIAPYVALGGESYLTLKLASVLVSLGALAGTWLLARRLAGAQFAALAVLVAGTGSWLLIFSRLGNSQIVVPVLATISIWLVVRFAQERRQRDLALSAVVAALGLYAYPQAFPLAPIAAATLVALRWTGAGIRWGDVGRYLAYAALAAVPFAVIVASDPAAFTGDYIGGKVGGSSDPLGALLRNAGRVAGSLHLHGDSGSRINPGGAPHLDVLSGILLLAGVAWWARAARRRWLPAILVPLIAQHVPSILVLADVSRLDVPSASRTLGAAPFAYLLVAGGIALLAELPRRTAARVAVAAVLCTAIVALNLQRYFGPYIDGLPLGDTPIAALIVDDARSAPDVSGVMLVGCCWEGQMPEPAGVFYGLQRSLPFETIDPRALSCERAATLAAGTLVVWSGRQRLASEQLGVCPEVLPGALVRARGRPIYRRALVP